VKSKKFILF